MSPWVILLRGVNVGGAGKLPMAEWRALLAEQGFDRPETFIQSGNAVIGSDLPREAIAARIGEGIASRFGFRPEVFVRRPEEIEALRADHPFAGDDPARVYVFLLGGAPDGIDPDRIAALAARGERWVMSEAAFVLSAPEGMGRSVLAERIGRILKVPMTARNLRTLQALAEMASRR